MAAKKADVEIPIEKLDLYEKLIAASNKKIERKGATMPYTSMNGNMFSFLSKTGELSIRLPEEERNEFIKKFKTKLSVQHGVTMKEYVVVPESLFKKTKELVQFFEKSFEYTISLKSKKK